VVFGVITKKGYNASYSEVYREEQKGRSVMAFPRKLTQIGNFKGLILSSLLLDILGWDANTELDLQIESRKLIVTAADRRDATTEGTKTPTPTKKLPKS